MDLLQEVLRDAIKGALVKQAKDKAKEHFAVEYEKSVLIVTSSEAEDVPVKIIVKILINKAIDKKEAKRILLKDLSYFLSLEDYDKKYFKYFIINRENYETMLDDIILALFFLDDDVRIVSYVYY